MTDERQEKPYPETEDEFKFPNLDGSKETARLAHLVAHMTGTKIVSTSATGLWTSIPTLSSTNRS